MQKVRTNMLALFYIAIPVGSALGYIVGGQVAAAAGSWRWALRVSPPFGLILVFLTIFFITEPPRGHSDGKQINPRKACFSLCLSPFHPLIPCS